MPAQGREILPDSAGAKLKRREVPTICADFFCRENLQPTGALKEERPHNPYFFTLYQSDRSLISSR